MDTLRSLAGGHWLAKGRDNEVRSKTLIKCGFAVVPPPQRLIASTGVGGLWSGGRLRAPEHYEARFWKCGGGGRGTLLRRASYSQSPDCFRVAARHALVRLAVAMDDTQLAQPHRPGIGAAFYCFVASRVLSARPPDSAC